MSAMVLCGSGCLGWSARLLRRPHAPPHAPPPLLMTQLEPEQSARATPWFVWGAGGDEVSEPASEASGLGELSSSYGWCLLDSELKEMQSYQVSVSSTLAAC